MDDREVELIDILRGLWQGKWIMLGCLAVAIGPAVAFVAARHPTYNGSAAYVVQEYVSATFNSCAQATTAFDNALALALGEIPRVLPDATVRYDNRRVEVTRSARASVEDIELSLALAGKALENQISLFLIEQLAFLEAGTRLQEKTLQAQIEKLKDRLTEQAWLEEAAVPEQLSELVAALAQAQVRLELLVSVDAKKLFEMRPVGEPTITTVHAYPAATVVISALLGLGIGGVLAMLAHSRRKSHEKAG